METENTTIPTLDNKNAEVKRLRLTNAGLIIIVVLLVATLLFLAIASRLTPPSPRPSIDVLQRHLYEGKYGLKVPTEITVGKLFNYQSEGKKLVDNNPEVRLQTVCRANGVETIQTIATFTSIGVTKGDFKINRSTTVTPSTKNVPSNDCELQSLATYTFYSVDSNGNESSFTVTETARSNKFKLIVPTNSEAPTTQSSVNTPQNTVVGMGTTSTSSQNPNVAQSNIAPIPQQSQTQPQNQPQNETPNGTIPEQPETRFIRRTVNGLLDIVGL